MPSSPAPPSPSAESNNGSHTPTKPEMQRKESSMSTASTQRAYMGDEDSSSSDSEESSRAPSIFTNESSERTAAEEDSHDEKSDAEEGKSRSSTALPKLTRLFSATSVGLLTSPSLHSSLGADYKTQMYLCQEAKRHNEKKAAEAALRKLNKEKLASNAITIWEKEIIPHWEQKHDLKQTRQLFKLGLPAKVRGPVWFLAMGNSLNVTTDLYAICLQRARAALKYSVSKERGDTPAEDIGSSLVLGREDTVKLIDMDLARTFPNIGLFQPTGPMHESLKDVLQAYVCYRPDIGYVQGMSFIAAMLLINMEPYEAFQTITNMLNRGCHMAFFTMDIARIDGYKAVHEELFAEVLPELAAHFAENNVRAEMYLLDWLMTMFAKSLPLELAMRIWDRYFLYGEIFLFRCALGILSMMSVRLMSQEFDGIAYDLTHLPIIYDEEEFFAKLKAVKIPEKRFAQAVAAHVAPRK